ncbi:hypothetical protein ACLB2K_025087 [Fragaria x ananassa]
MTSLSQGLYLQLSQLRDPKKQEEEENEAQNQAGDAQEQKDYEARVEAKQPNMNDGRYGKIVKVQDGHIVRSTKKDRHTKVLTTKGPRDRRFRLAAQTAIEFYDVQDRLGYARPSMVIDWLIQKAKASIEALENSSTVQQPQHHQGGPAEPETAEIHQHFDESAMNNVSKEPVLGFAEEVLNYATNLSEADFTEMAISQSLMAYNYYTGAGGYNAGAEQLVTAYKAIT